jgi:hypothetical protein
VRGAVRRTIDKVGSGELMLTRTIAISLAVQLLLSGFCVGQTADPGPIRVGDRWTYNIKDGVTGDLKHAVTLVVIEVDQKEITTRVTGRGNSPFTIFFDPGWSRIDDGTWKHRPSELTGVRTPLEVGKEWRAEGNSMNMHSGLVFRTSAFTKVTGQERVTVPAGTFDTFRVEPMVRMTNTADQTKSSTITGVIWYAPAINRWVKRISEFRYEGRLRDSTIDELTEYSRRP